MSSKRAISVAVTAGAIVLAGGVGAAFGALNNGHRGSEATRVDRPLTPAERPSFAHNAKNQTFGSVGDLKDPADEPDLILVVANEGGEGYVLRDQLNGPMPGSPAEAVAQAKAPQSRVIPVFVSDGVTKIGTFTIGPDAPR